MLDSGYFSKLNLTVECVGESLLDPLGSPQSVNLTETGYLGFNQDRPSDDHHRTLEHFCQVAAVSRRRPIEVLAL